MNDIKRTDLFGVDDTLAALGRIERLLEQIATEIRRDRIEYIPIDDRPIADARVDDQSAGEINLDLITALEACQMLGGPRRSHCDLMSRAPVDIRHGSRVERLPYIAWLEQIGRVQNGRYVRKRHYNQDWVTISWAEPDYGLNQQQATKIWREAPIDQRIDQPMAIRRSYLDLLVQTKRLV